MLSFKIKKLILISMFLIIYIRGQSILYFNPKPICTRTAIHLFGFYIPEATHQGVHTLSLKLGRFWVCLGGWGNWRSDKCSYARLHTFEWRAGKSSAAQTPPFRKRIAFNVAPGQLAKRSLDSGT